VRCPQNSIEKPKDPKQEKRTLKHSSLEVRGLRSLGSKKVVARCSTDLQTARNSNETWEKKNPRQLGGLQLAN